MTISSVGRSRTNSGRGNRRSGKRKCGRSTPSGGRLAESKPCATVTAARILELAKQAENLYKSQDPPEQQRLLETVLSNCTFDRGTLCPTYSKPFDLLVRGNKTAEWLLRLDSNQQPSG